MFNWLSNTIKESVAPLFRSNLEQFVHTWGKVEEEYGAIMGKRGVDLDDPEVLKNSQMADFLNALVETLVLDEEDHLEQAQQAQAKNNSSRTIPACFEYLLEHQVIDKLCALGLPDRPPGMRTMIIQTVDAILMHTSVSILPNMSVHSAVNHFIQICYKKGDLFSPVAKSSFVSLLRTLCTKMRDEQSLAGIFFEGSQDTTKIDQTEFVVFRALSTLMNDDDHDAEVALEGLMCLVQLPNERISQYLISQTDYCQQLVKGLRARYNRLPQNMSVVGNNNNNQNSNSISRGSSSNNNNDNNDDGFHDIDEDGENPLFKSFASRLIYIDVIAESTYKSIGQCITQSLLDDFLLPVIKPQLLNMQENVAQCSTMYVQRMIEIIESPVLRHVMVRFLLGEDKDSVPNAHIANNLAGSNDNDNDNVNANGSKGSPETPKESPESSPLSDSKRSSRHKRRQSRGRSKKLVLRNTLIKRIDSLSEELSQATLSLFDALLGMREQEVVHNLILQYLEPLNHIRDTEFVEFSKRKNSFSIRQSTGTLDAILSNFPAMKPLYKHRSYEDYLVDAQAEEESWMQAWEKWHQTSLSSSSSLATAATTGRKKNNNANADAKDSSSSDEKGNKNDSSSISSSAAAAGTNNAAAIPEEKDTKGKELASLASPTSSSQASAFDEGLFLNIIFNKLSEVFDNSFDTNLRLTSILAKLAYTPHPLIHSFLLDPNLPTKDHVRVMFKVLGELWAKGQDRAQSMPNYNERLKHSKMRLDSEGGANINTMVETMDGHNFLCGMILLEEFVKELLSISQAKSNLYGIVKLAGVDSSLVMQRNVQRVRNRASSSTRSGPV